MPIDWLNMANPFVDPNESNAFRPQGDMSGLNPLLMLSFIAPEEAATLAAKSGWRPNRVTPDPGLLPPAANTPAPAANSAVPTPDEGVIPPGASNPQGANAPTGGPSGLTGNASTSSVLRALSALKAVAPPRLPVVPAPAAARPTAPPVYRPDASSLMGLIQMLGQGNQQMPTLAQLIGR